MQASSVTLLSLLCCPANQAVETTNRLLNPQRERESSPSPWGSVVSSPSLLLSTSWAAEETMTPAEPPGKGAPPSPLSSAVFPLLHFLVWAGWQGQPRDSWTPERGDSPHPARFLSLSLSFTAQHVGQLRQSVKVAGPHGEEEALSLWRLAVSSSLLPSCQLGCKVDHGGSWTFFSEGFTCLPVYSDVWHAEGYGCINRQGETRERIEWYTLNQEATFSL